MAWNHINPLKTIIKQTEFEKSIYHPANPNSVEIAYNNSCSFATPSERKDIKIKGTGEIELASAPSFTVQTDYSVIKCSQKRQTVKLSDKEFTGLFKAFEENDFLRLENEYADHSVHDGCESSVSLKVGEFQKKVKNYMVALKPFGIIEKKIRDILNVKFGEKWDERSFFESSCLKEKLSFVFNSKEREPLLIALYRVTGDEPYLLEALKEKLKNTTDDPEMRYRILQELYKMTKDKTYLDQLQKEFPDK